MIIVIMKIVVIMIVMIVCVIKEPGGCSTVNNFVLRQNSSLWPWQVTFLEMITSIKARDCIS